MLKYVTKAKLICGRRGERKTVLCMSLSVSLRERSNESMWSQMVSVNFFQNNNLEVETSLSSKAPLELGHFLGMRVNFGPINIQETGIKIILQGHCS